MPQSTYALYADDPAGEAWYAEIVPGVNDHYSYQQIGGGHATYHGSVATLAEAEAWVEREVAAFRRARSDAGRGWE